jgi:transketolase
MRVLPNMTVISPASPLEARKATFAAAQIYGPVYIRLGTTKEPEIYEGDYDFQAGRGVTLLEGSDVVLMATGSIVGDALMAARELHRQGITVRLINMHTIKPIDKEIIVKAAKEIGAILTLEEHNVVGGLGSAVGEVLLEQGPASVWFERMGVYDRFCNSYGSHQDLKAVYGLSKEDIKVRATLLYHKKMGVKSSRAYPAYRRVIRG